MIGGAGREIRSCCEAAHSLHMPLRLPRWPPLAHPGASDSFRAVPGWCLDQSKDMSESRQRHLRVVNSEPAPAAPLPRVWLLLGERQGDNAQVLALGRALTQDLGWPHETKQLSYDPNCDVPFRDRGATLIGVDLGRSDALAPPWPDVVNFTGESECWPSRWKSTHHEPASLSI